MGKKDGGGSGGVGAEATSVMYASIGASSSAGTKSSGCLGSGMYTGTGSSSSMGSGHYSKVVMHAQQLSGQLRRKDTQTGYSEIVP
ncbi:hypothetical protein Tco_1368808 [Tanacetum coccineum]